jgi:spermidine/putrescine transport system ATP-binding protein
MTGATDLDVRSVAKRFGAMVAVDGVSFAVPEGSFFSILGPSGCGKTTLMRMIAGFMEPDDGDILIKGRSVLGVPPNRRPVNMVFQNLALFPMMSVGENIAYGLRCHGVPKADIATRVTGVLARVNLPGFAERRIDQLSGGQKQRIAIARCLVLEPALVLLDEPLGALDLKLREHMKIELKQLQAEFGTTFVYITHDQSEALVMSNQVAVMHHGRFEQVGTPQELYYRPRTAFVAGFVGNSNRWTGRVAGRQGDEVRVAIGAAMTQIARRADGALADTSDVTVFVRPEAIALALAETDIAAMPNHFRGRVETILFDGANSTIQIAEEGGGGVLNIALPQVGPCANVTPGQIIWCGWPSEAALCFGTAT